MIRSAIFTKNYIKAFFYNIFKKILKYIKIKKAQKKK